MPLDVLGGYENLICVLHLHVTAVSQNITRRCASNAPYQSTELINDVRVSTQTSTWVRRELPILRQTGPSFSRACQHLPKVPLSW